MKRRNAVRIDELIRRAIDEAGSSATFEAQRVCYLWPEIVGPTINRFTTARWVVRDELHVTIASGAVKSELTFLSDKLLERLNAAAGAGADPVVRRLIIH